MAMRSMRSVVKSVATSTIFRSRAMDSSASVIAVPCSMDATPASMALRAPCSVTQWAATFSPERAASSTAARMSSAE